MPQSGFVDNIFIKDLQGSMLTQILNCHWGAIVTIINIGGSLYIDIQAWGEEITADKYMVFACFGLPP